ncbi:DUF551 domain-containing protein [Klebsiella pneumoniae]|nr:DUF551 domain-containing protein [Klebsiella pneumoniae]
MKFEEWLSQQNGVIEVDCGCVTTEAFYHWMRVAYEAGNSPAIPDGYVMVPDDLKEATADLLATLDDYPEQLVPINRDSSVVRALRAAMLAAAPQSPGSEPATVPGKWIPVSERMPERGDYLVTDGCDFDVQLFNGEQFIPGFVWEDKITHWMPLPAAPQGVIHG